MSEADYTIYTNLEQAYQIDLDAVHLAAWHALKIAEAQAPAALTITITTTERLQEFNRQYAGLDEPTDVLAFASGEEPHATEPGEPPYLGDVVIAYPVAEEQAHSAGIPVPSCSKERIVPGMSGSSYQTRLALTNTGLAANWLP